MDYEQIYMDANAERYYEALSAKNFIPGKFSGASVAGVKKEANATAEAIEGLMKALNDYAARVGQNPKYAGVAQNAKAAVEKLAVNAQEYADFMSKYTAAVPDVAEKPAAPAAQNPEAVTRENALGAK